MDIQTVFQKIKTSYKVAFLLYLLLAFNAFVNGSQVLHYLSYLMAGVGGLLVLGQVTLNFKRIRVPNLWILLLFMASYVFSSLMNMRYGWVENVQGLVWMAIPIFLLYVDACSQDSVTRQKEFKLLGIIYIVYCTVANLICLSMLYTGVMYDFVDQTGTPRPIGYRWGRLWGLYDDPNHGGVMALIALFLLLYFLKTVQKKWIRILAGIGVAIQYQYILYSDSRTAMVALLVGVFAWVMFQGYTKHRKVLISLLSAILLCGLAYGLTYVKVPVYDFSTKFIPVIDHWADGGSIKKLKKNRKKDLKGNESNGRTAIWLSGLEIAKTSPIYGTSYRNMTVYTEENLPDSYFVSGEQTYDSMHDLIVDVLVSQGVIGLFLLVLLFGNTLRILWKRIKNQNLKEITEEGADFIQLGILLCVVAVCSLFLTILFYLSCPENAMFWLLFGNLMGIQTGGENG